MTLENLTQRLRMVRMNYPYVPAMTVAEEKAWTLIWSEALKSVPVRFSADAFNRWFLTETERPTFADIARSALKNVAEAYKRLREEEPRPEALPPAPPTEEEIKRRQDLMEEFGFARDDSQPKPKLKKVPKCDGD